MPFISCFYNHCVFQPYNIIFIEFEKFVKVIFKHKAFILKKEDLVSNTRLFQVFMLSLVLTKDTSKVHYGIDKFTQKIIYGQLTIWYWKNLRTADYHRFAELEKSSSKNPLKASEPKRSSSAKKVRKFFKAFNKAFGDNRIKDPIEIFNEFFEEETAEIFDYFNRYIEHERKIEMLSVVLHNYGRDVYSGVQQFL